MYQNANYRAPESQTANPQPYSVTHDFGGTATLSETVIHTISGAANVDVSKVEQALARQLDPSALDRLFRYRDPSVQSLDQLSLSVLGHCVTIYSNGQIVIAQQNGHR